MSGSRLWSLIERTAQLASGNIACFTGNIAAR
jgi:hypothetical protein